MNLTKLLDRSNKSVNNKNHVTLRLWSGKSLSLLLHWRSYQYWKTIQSL